MLPVQWPTGDPAAARAGLRALVAAAAPGGGCADRRVAVAPDDSGPACVRRPLLPAPGPAAGAGAVASEAPLVRALSGAELDHIADGGRALAPPGGGAWPFLLRFPIVFFGVPIGLAAQSTQYAALDAWQAAPRPAAARAFRAAQTVLWFAAVVLVVAVASAYAAKLRRWPAAARREFFHPVRANFFFAPFLAGTVCVLGVPDRFEHRVACHVVFLSMSALHLLLALYMYASWYYQESRTLHRGNPAYQISVVNNFMLSTLGCNTGFRECALFFFAVGLLFQVTVFVGLHSAVPNAAVQPRRPPSAGAWAGREGVHTLPPPLHPILFLFVAPPAAASLSAGCLAGGAEAALPKACLYVSLFLYAMQLYNFRLFATLPFSPAWWAYTFPMTACATAAVKHADAVGGAGTAALAAALCALSSVTVAAVLCATLRAACCSAPGSHQYRALFPVDNVVAVELISPMEPDGPDGACGCATPVKIHAAPPPAPSVHVVLA